MKCNLVNDSNANLDAKQRMRERCIYTVDVWCVNTLHMLHFLLFHSISKKLKKKIEKK